MKKIIAFAGSLAALLAVAIILYINRNSLFVQKENNEKYEVISIVGNEVKYVKNTEGFDVYTDDSYDYYVLPENNHMMMILYHSHAKEQAKFEKDELIKNVKSYVSDIYPEMDLSGWKITEEGIEVAARLIEKVNDKECEFAIFRFNKAGVFQSANINIDAIDIANKKSKDFISDEDAINLAQKYCTNELKIDKKEMENYVPSVRYNIIHGNIRIVVSFKGEVGGYYIELDPLSGKVLVADQYK